LSAVQRQEAADEEELQTKRDPAALPRQAPLAGNSRPAAERGGEDGAGIPDGLRTGLERLSGLDLSAVRVHYNSPRPARLAALAYAQGTNIHLAPGQERHLPHEGWHVVQQMKGRVQPTIRAKGVPINDDPALESEADVMGARASRHSERGRATCCQTRPAAAEGADLHRRPTIDPVDTNLQAVARHGVMTGISSGALPVIQRAAPFTPTPPSPEINLAEHFIAGYMFTGITIPTLGTNKTPIFEEADAIAAIRAPTLQDEAGPNGTVVAKVKHVPTNEAGFVMAVPTPGPWSTTTDKAKAAFLFRKFPGLAVPLSCLMPGRTTLTVNGKPTDAEFVTNALTHENLHAKDHDKAFKNVIAAWDTRLQAAQTAGTGFPGATSADARAALYRAMGGTPPEIAAKQHQEWQALNDALHAAGQTVATGGPATPSNATADSTCTTSSVDLT
jgi:hypothetical protein